MSKKILLIEDDTLIRDLYQRILGQQGYTILTSADGAEGLELAKKQPDLILLDIMIPKINGMIVLSKLKSTQETKNIPIVLLTNLSDYPIIKEAFGLGVSGYLLKANNTPYEIASQIKKFLNDPNYKMDINKLTVD